MVWRAPSKKRQCRAIIFNKFPSGPKLESCLSRKAKKQKKSLIIPRTQIKSLFILISMAPMDLVVSGCLLEPSPTRHKHFPILHFDFCLIYITVGRTKIRQPIIYELHSIFSGTLFQIKRPLPGSDDVAK